VSGELFKMMSGVDMLHVPYRGMAPALTAGDVRAGPVEAGDKTQGDRVRADRKNDGYGRRGVRQGVPTVSAGSKGAAARAKLRRHGIFDGRPVGMGRRYPPHAAAQPQRGGVSRSRCPAGRRAGERGERNEERYLNPCPAEAAPRCSLGLLRSPPASDAARAGPGRPRSAFGLASGLPARRAPAMARPLQRPHLGKGDIRALNRWAAFDP
jgi:hypothetical protein